MSANDKDSFNADTSSTTGTSRNPSIRSAVLNACGDDILRAVDYTKSNRSKYADLTAVRKRVKATAPGWTDEVVKESVRWLVSEKGGRQLNVGRAYKTVGMCKLSRGLLERRNAAMAEAAAKKRAEVEFAASAAAATNTVASDASAAECHICNICGQSSKGRATLIFPSKDTRAGGKARGDMICVHESCANDESFTVVHLQLRILPMRDVRERYGTFLQGSVLDSMVQKVRTATCIPFNRETPFQENEQDDGIEVTYCLAREFEAWLREVLVGLQGPTYFPSEQAASANRSHTSDGLGGGWETGAKANTAVQKRKKTAKAIPPAETSTAVASAAADRRIRQISENMLSQKRTGIVAALTKLSCPTCRKVFKSAYGLAYHENRRVCKKIKANDSRTSSGSSSSTESAAPSAQSVTVIWHTDHDRIDVAAV